MTNCDASRYTDPAGVWNYEDMIGATVRIKSVPISYFSSRSTVCENNDYIIEDIQFRVSLDGKTITMVYLKDVEGTFTFKDLEVLSLCCGKKLEKTIYEKGESLEIAIDGNGNYDFDNLEDYGILIKKDSTGVTVKTISKDKGSVSGDYYWRCTLDTNTLPGTGSFTIYFYVNWTNANNTTGGIKNKIRTIKITK